ncbi:prepilin-type N-terminal cleavage/methylation domain-containing protein [Nitrospirota bacterium]
MRFPFKLSMPGVMNKKGFTMIELLAVLFIISIGFAIVSISIGRSFDKRVLRDEAARMRNTLRFAREQAMTKRMPMSVGFDEEGRRYWVEDGNNRVLPRGVELEGTGTIIFFSRGDSTGGEVALKGAGVIKYKVEVDSVTGKATVLRVQTTDP